jgi:hypothetical protein
VFAILRTSVDIPVIVIVRGEVLIGQIAFGNQTAHNGKAFTTKRLRVFPTAFADVIAIVLVVIVEAIRVDVR